MLCQNCNKNEATTYYKETINGQTRELHLCPECAAKLTGSAPSFGSMFSDPFFSNPFGSFFAEPFGASAAKPLWRRGAGDWRRQALPNLRHDRKRIAPHRTCGMRGLLSEFQRYPDAVYQKAARRSRACGFDPGGSRSAQSESGGGLESKTCRRGKDRKL